MRVDPWKAFALLVIVGSLWSVYAAAQEEASGLWTRSAGGVIRPSNDSDTISGAGHTIRDEGVDLTARTGLNFVGAGITCTDDAGNDETDCSVGGGGGSAHTIRDEGSDLPARTGLNFIGATVACADDAGNDETDCTVTADHTHANQATLDAVNSAGDGDIITATERARIGTLPILNFQNYDVGGLVVPEHFNWVRPALFGALTSAGARYFVPTGRTLDPDELVVTFQNSAGTNDGCQFTALYGDADTDTVADGSSSAVVIDGSSIGASAALDLSGFPALTDGWIALEVDDDGVGTCSAGIWLAIAVFGTLD